MAQKSLTTFDKAITTGLGFLITVLGLAAEAGGALHLKPWQVLILVIFVGIASTVLTYYRRNAEHTTPLMRKFTKLSPRRKKGFTA